MYCRFPLYAMKIEVVAESSWIKVLYKFANIPAYAKGNLFSVRQNIVAQKERKKSVFGVFALNGKENMKKKSSYVIVNKYSNFIVA